jgi:hypothetical protein
MNLTITETEVLRYIYGDCTPPETLAIREELKKNMALRSYHDRMMETKMELDKIEMEPSETSISIILEYSASHHDSLEHH